MLKIFAVCFVVISLLAWALYLQSRPTTGERCHDLGLVEMGTRAGQAPMRPSEQRWYDEHCWRGLPRADKR